MFIASAQETVRLLSRSALRLSMVALALIFTANHSQAGLGWTLAQLEQQYGKPVLNQERIAGRVGCVFRGEDYNIAAFFLNRKVSRIMYVCREGSVFDWARARALLSANAPDAIWADAFKNEADNSYRVSGTKDGVETYYASLTDNGTTLVIWTKEDDEAARTSPKLDRLSKDTGSNEKSIDETTAGQAPSIGSESTPKINPPDEQANATSRVPPQRLISAHAAHPKILNVRVRSSKRSRHADAKTRLIALWHQSLRNRKSRDKTSFSNSSKGTRKKGTYSAERRH